ncbi:MAG: class I SAM-dependent methyltransferase [Acidobacteriota bacterium]|nr:class I SAM-dependent methyltransferase [Acidobacteriota bacterium]
MTAFDLAPTAIEWCRRRFASSDVDYRVADLYALPSCWSRAFDLVVEVYTFQALPAEIRPEAMDKAADLVAEGGRLVLVCRLREAGEEAEGPPWPLTREELTRLEKAGLSLLESVEVGDPDDRPVRRLRQVYRRGSAGGAKSGPRTPP